MYVHLRPDGTPFYVGKGTKARSLWKKRRANPYHKNIVAKYGLKSIRSVIVKRGLSESASFFYEKEAIACLRDFDYRLCNLTDGGEGSTGWKAPSETRARMSATRKGRPGTPHTLETRKHLREMAILRDPSTRMHSSETRKRISENHKGKKFSEAHREKLRQYARNRPLEVRKKLSAWAKAHRASAETKEKMRLAHSGKRASEETKHKMSIARKLYWERRKGERA